MKTVDVKVKDANETDVVISYELPETLDEALSYYGEKAEEMILTQVQRMNTTDVRNGARTKLKAGTALEEVQKAYSGFKPGCSVGGPRGDATKTLLSKAEKMDATQLQALIAQLQSLQK